MDNSECRCDVSWYYYVAAIILHNIAFTLGFLTLLLWNWHVLSLEGLPHWGRAYSAGLFGAAGQGFPYWRPRQRRNRTCRAFNQTQQSTASPQQTTTHVANTVGYIKVKNTFHTLVKPVNKASAQKVLKVWTCFPLNLILTCILVITGKWILIIGSEKENGRDGHELPSIYSPCLLFKWSMRFCVHSICKLLPEVYSIFHH